MLVCTDIRVGKCITRVVLRPHTCMWQRCMSVCVSISGRVLIVWVFKCARVGKCITRGCCAFINRGACLCAFLHVGVCELCGCLSVRVSVGKRTTRGDVVPPHLHWQRCMSVCMSVQGRLHTQRQQCMSVCMSVWGVCGLCGCLSVRVRYKEQGVRRSIFKST